MINKRELFRKLKKNRFLVLAISVIVITGVYYGAQKAIDLYSFNSNSDFVEFEDVGNEVVNGEQEVENKGWFEKLFGGGEGVKEVRSGEDEGVKEDGVEDGAGTEDNAGEADNSGKVPEDEVDLELEETVEGVTDADENLEQEDGSSGDEEKIYVYITGEVNVPGVVILNKGSRIVDAINAAGGTTVKANVSKVNLVYVLDDGMKVNIPNNNDLKNNPDFEYITMSSGDGANDAGVTGNSSVDSWPSNSGSVSNYSVVNINTATQTELESLPGIGPSLALKIINYRKDNGKFSSIEEIKNVSGIGESKFESLKDFIAV